MNAKYALALILALQVSMSMCEIPAPSDELVEKYSQMKAVFLKRLLNAYDKIQVAAAPYIAKVGESKHGQAIKDKIEDLQAKSEFQAVAKVGTALAQEAGPIMDTARTAILRAYEYSMRPYLGEFISNAVDRIKVYLDVFLPAQ